MIFNFKLPGTLLGEEPGHVILVFLLGDFDELVTLEVLDFVVFELVELVVVLFVLFKPQFHHGGSGVALLLELPPSAGFVVLVKSDVVLAHALVFPLETGGVDGTPQVKPHFKFEVIILIPAVSTEVQMGLSHINCLIQ